MAIYLRSLVMLVPYGLPETKHYQLILYEHIHFRSKNGDVAHIVLV